MDETINNSTVDKIAKLARSAAGVKSLGRNDRLIAVPDGVSLVSEESILKPGLSRTTSIDRTEKVSSSQSFVDFIEQYGTENSVVFVDTASGIAQAILNYIPKEEAPNSDAHSDDPLPSEDVVAYRCDWQVLYSLEVSERWTYFKSVLQTNLSARKRAMKLAALKDYFFEVYEDDTEELSFKGSNRTALYPEIFKADVATEDNMLDIIFDRPASWKRLIASFSIPVHHGTSPMEISVFIENKAGKISMSIIEEDAIVEKSAQQGLSKVKAKLKANFNVFDADLSELTV